MQPSECRHLREFHAHKETTHKERHHHTDECHGQQQYSIQPRCRRLIRLIQNHKPESSHCEQKTGCQTLHDILTIDAILHKCHLKKTAPCAVNTSQRTKWFFYESGQCDTSINVFLMPMCACCPVLWLLNKYLLKNTVPVFTVTIQQYHSLSLSLQRLKTHLFHKSFPVWSFGAFLTAFTKF